MIKEDGMAQLTVPYTISHQLALVAGPNNDPLKKRLIKPGTVLRVLAVRDDGKALCSTRLNPPRIWGTVFPVDIAHLTPYDSTVENGAKVL